MFVNPEVWDPLGPCQDWAGRVPSQDVTFPIPVQVVPEGRGSFWRPQGEVEWGEHRGPSEVDVRDVEQPGGYSVARTQAGKSSWFFFL